MRQRSPSENEVSASFWSELRRRAEVVPRGLARTEMESTAEKQESHLRIVPPEVEELQAVTVRFCGDSGDGMQLTGTEFTKSSALTGNDLATFPDFPAEIRAPAGTLPGVSGFQVQFSSHEIYTPGDAPDVLVAMNPAALKTNLADLVAERHPHRQHRRLQRDQPPEGRLRQEPPRGRLAERQVPALQGRHHQDDRARAGRQRPRLQGRRPLQEHVRPGLVFWMYGRNMDRTHRGSASTSSAPRTPPSPTPTSRPSRPATTTARPPRSSRTSTR